MNKTLGLILILILGNLRGYTQDSRIAIGERITFHSGILNEDRRLLIYLPDNYSTSAEKYPVIYLLDAEGQFMHTAGIIKFLTDANCIPPAIIVGIRNTNRNRDLSPPTESSRDLAHIPGAGGAVTFNEFLKNELVPFIDKTYRTQPFRILMGHSLAGLFTVHTLLNDSSVFQGFIASSPSLFWNDEGELARAKKVLQPNSMQGKLLYISMSTETENMQGPVYSFSKFLESGQKSMLTWKYDYFPDKTHETVPHMAFYNGIMFLFSGWKFDITPLYEEMQANTEISILSSLTEHYNALSKKFGYRCKPSEAYVNNLGYDLLNHNYISAATEIFLYNTKNYPSSANAFDSFGEALELEGQLKEALAAYEKAVENGRKNNDANLGQYQANLDRVKNAVNEQK